MDYFVNEEHSIVKTILESNTISKKDVRELIQLIGQTTPIESIILNYSEDLSRMKCAQNRINHVKNSQMIFDGLIKQGYSKKCNQICIE